jgi:RNA polymerase sigma-70 factor (ECF subfamily)
MPCIQVLVWIPRSSRGMTASSYFYCPYDKYLSHLLHSWGRGIILKNFWSKVYGVREKYYASLDDQPPPFLMRVRTQNDSSAKLNDAEIIRQILHGHTNTFESLLARYQDLVLKIVKKHIPFRDIEETTQDVFIRVYQSLPTFKGKGDCKQWLCSIALRTCYDYWRKAYRSREIPMSSLTMNHREWLEDLIGSEHGGPIHEKAAQDEAKELLDWALGKLSAKDRIILELIYLEGLTCKEAANLLGWSLANIKVRAFRSRKKLERILTQVLRR